MKTLHISIIMIFLIGLLFIPLHLKSVQADETAKEKLNKKLETAREIIANMMIYNNTSDIPFNMVGVDVLNSTLDVGIDSTKATLSKDEYQKKIEDIVGDIPINIEMGVINLTGSASTNNVSGNESLSSLSLSPLKQFKSGIAAKDIKCTQGLQLVIKTEDGSPACLRPDTAYRLILKGWAKEFIQSVQTRYSEFQCGREVPSGDLRTGTVPVLMMQPNSTATICVTYQFISDWNSYPNKEIYPHGILETCCFLHMGQYPDTQTSKFDILADPLLFNVTGVFNGSKTTVVYTIHAGPNSKGFYDSSVPFGSCNSYPLAVGHDSSQINAADFSYDMDIPCFNTIDKVNSVSILSGMSYKEVAFR